MTVQKLPCPTCGKATPVSKLPHLPFCSERCRLIDLGRWLDEEHTLPATADDDEGTDATETSMSSSPDDRPPIRLPPGWHDA